jgi:hypothetical protein
MRKDTRVFVALVVGALLRVGLAVLVPPFDAPDERSHLAVVQDVVQQHQYPAGELTGTNYEARFQPPLYYVLASWVYRAVSPGHGARASASSSFAGSIDPGVLALRMLSVALGVLNCLLIYRVAAACFPMHPEVLFGSVAFACLLPTSISSSVSVSNDALANVCGSLFLLLLISGTARLSPRRAALLALTAGLGFWVKYNVLALTPVVLLLGGGEGLRQRIRSQTFFWLGLAVLILPLVGRNLAIYGSPFGEARIDYSGVGLAGVARVLRNFGWSFWAAFGEFYGVHLPIAMYAVVFPLLTAGAVVGFARFLRAGSGAAVEAVDIETRTRLRLLVLAAVLTIGASISYSLSYVLMCSWGRYAFPALGAVSALFAFGWNSAWPRAVRRQMSWLPPVCLLLGDVYYLWWYAFGR